MAKKLSLLVLSLITTDFAFAAGGGAHTPSISDLNLYFINFGIYLVILAFIIKKTVPSAWQARREKIRTQLETWRGKIVQAESHLAESRGKLAAVASDAKKIELNIQKETEHEVKEIFNNATRASERMLQQAKDSVAAERKLAQGAAKKIYAELALAIAEEKLHKEITPEKDAKLRAKTQSEVARLLQ
jgi:F0F1-type ATP synthase membrane subunit b/b'